MPERIGRYEVVRAVGRGGMAVVYEARDPDLGRTVALKVLRDDAVGSLLPRLQREAAAVARLRHPNIVPVHEIGSEDGRHYIVMDFIAGPTLADARRHLSRRERLEAMHTIARAAAFAHQNGVVHRDLKPHNVLVEASSGRLFLTDFGLAKLSGSEVLTRTGAAVGTPSYMAPEQIRADTQIGPATDVWALGVMLYEMLADRLPFAEPSIPQLYERIFSADPARLQGVPTDVRTVCLKALEKEASRRYADADAFADDLRRAIDGEPISARPSSLGYHAWKRLRRNVPAAVMGALLVCALVAFAGVQGFRQSRARAAARDHTRAAESILGALPSDHRAAIDAILQAEDHARLAGDSALRYRSNRLLGERAMAAHDFGLARVAFSACRALRPHEDLLPLVREAEESEGRRRKSRIETALDDLRRGLGRPNRPPGSPLLEDYVFECVQYDDAQSVALLADALAPLTARAGAEERWSEDERTLMCFCFRVLGRLRCVLPLATMMERIHDESLAVECGQALCNTRLREAGSALASARERFGVNSGVWRQIEPLVARVPEAVPAPSEAEGFVERGLTLMARNELDGAIADFTRALEFDPDRVEAVLNRGIARHRKGDCSGAIDDYSQAARMNPSHSATFLNRGISRHALGDLDGALADLGHAIQLSPGDEVARNNRGLVRRDKGDVAGAIEDYTRAIEIAPRYTSAWNNRGLARRDRGDLDGALDDYSRAIEIDARHAAALNNRGNLKRDRGDLDGAIADFNRAIEVDPRYAAAFNNRGLARQRKGDLSGAASDYDRSIALDARYAPPYCNRGMVRSSLGDASGAIADWERFVELAPAHPQAPTVREWLRDARAQKR